jgi:hypothetical protein
MLAPQAEEGVQEALSSLIETHLGEVPLADWEAARGAGVDFAYLTDDVDKSGALINAGLQASAVTGAVTLTAASGFARTLGGELPE